MAQFLISAFADEAAEDLAGQIAALTRNGLICIEPRNVNGNLIKKTDEELFEIARQLKEAGISVSSLGSPIGKFDIHGAFDEHLADFERALRACEILGAKNMRVFSFFLEDGEKQECRDEVLRRMRILVERAARAGVTLCHENEADIYGQNPSEVKDLLENVEGLRGIFDGANYVAKEQDPLEGLAATLPHLEYLHVKDQVRETGEMVPCGMGDGCYEEVLRQVDLATDGVVYLTLEPHLHTFEAFSRIDKRTLKTALTFETADDAFDCAVTYLKNTLTKLGFHEGENNLWKK